MRLIAYVFRKLLTPNDVVTEMSKRARYKTPSENQHVKGSQRLLKSARQHFYPIFSSPQEKLSKKKKQVLCEILELLVHTLTADDKYSLHKREKLLQQNSNTTISEKKKFFFICEISIKLRTFFEKKMRLIAYIFWKSLTPKEVVT